MNLINKIKNHKFKTFLAVMLVAVMGISIPIFAERFHSTEEAYSVLPIDGWGKSATTFIKKDSQNRFVYCMNRDKKQPPLGGIDYGASSEITNNSVYNILLYGFPNHRFSDNPTFDYMVTQLALWDELGQLGPGFTSLTFAGVDKNIKIVYDAYTAYPNKMGFDKSSNGKSVSGDYFIACIGDLLTKARNTDNSQRVGINLSSSNVTATLNNAGDYYISSYIQFKPIGGTLNADNNQQLTNLTLTVNKDVPGLCVYSATGELIPFNGRTFSRKLRVDAKIGIAIPYGTPVSDLQFTVSGDVNYNAVYKYTAPSGQYQDIANNTIVKSGNVNKQFTVKWQEPTGSVQITKVDEDTKSVLPGVKFSLERRDDSGNWSTISEKTTDNNGIIRWDNLPLGYYQVKELSTLPGYILRSDAIPVGDLTVDNANLTTTITNKKETASLKIVKTNANGTENLAGVKFKLLDANGNPAEYADGTPTEEKVTDSNGVVVWDNLVLGTYFIREVETLPGYRLLDNDVSVILDTPKEVKVTTIKNSKQSGAVAITKKGDDGKLLQNVQFKAYTDSNCTNEYASAVTNVDGVATLNYLVVGQKYYIKETKGANGYVLDPSPFEVTITQDKQVLKVERINKQEKASIELLKTNDNGSKKLEGAKFQLYNDKKEAVGSPKTSDANGIIRWDNLLLGTYYIKEVEAPKGYILDTAEHKVSLNKNAEVVKITMVNTIVKDNIRITKQSLQSKRDLAGAEFTLYNLDGTVVTGIPNPSVTNKYGVCTFNGVPAGEYIIKETKAPEGYILDTTEHRINTLDSNANARQLDITNEKMPFRLKVIKVDKDTTVTLAGAKFVLLDEGNSPVAKDDNPSTPNEWNAKVYTTDENGEIFMDEDLDFGTYKLMEIKPPEGYIPIYEPFVFTINEDTKFESDVMDGKDARIYTIRVGNDRGEGTLEITKKDVSTGELLPNTTFTIYAADKSTVITTGVTDEEGIARFVLPTGQYYYQESQAPEGYQIDTSLFPFEIKEDGEIVKCEMTNSKLPQTGLIVRNLALPTLLVLGSSILFIGLRLTKRKHS